MRKASTSRRSVVLLGLGLLLGAAPAPAVAAPADTTTAATGKPMAPLPADPGPVRHPRAADARHLRELREERAFQYVEAQDEPGLWERFWAWVWEQLGKLQETKRGRITWRVLVYGLAIAALVLAVLKLLQVELTSAFGRAPRRVPLAYDTAGEDIHGVDFSTRLAEAEAAGDYRLALRLGYLQLLKQLSDQGLIQWQPDKTNHAYSLELPTQGGLRAAFRELSREFEYAWYGELALDAALYEQARAGQRALHRQLAAPAY